MQRLIVVAIVLLLLASLVSFYVGFQHNNPWINNLGLVCALISWVLIRWLDERSVLRHQGQKDSTILIRLSFDAFVGLVVGLLFYGIDNETLRMLAAMSGMMFWGLWRVASAVRQKWLR